MKVVELHPFFITVNSEKKHDNKLKIARKVAPLFGGTAICGQLFQIFQIQI
jgi:hypothetical protein